MTTINLKRYYPYMTENVMLEVSDEIAAALSMGGRLCDSYNIPIATNLATAELLIKALERGDLEWRNI